MKKVCSYDVHKICICSDNIQIAPLYSSFIIKIGIVTQPPFNQPARVYDYKSEGQCDKHVDVFKVCIHSVRDVSPTHGFAALKVTALGNPKLLEQMSTMIVEVKRLFAKFDKKKTGLISREEFVHCYEEYFHVDDTKCPGFSTIWLIQIV